MQNAAVAAPAPATPTQLTATPIVIPPLNDGERWTGIVSVGTQLHHVILLPGDFVGNWKASSAWAKEQGGELPSHLEQSLLWAELKDQFQADWYWSCEQHASYPGYAWVQSFYDGYQHFDPTDDYYRARAVRRVTI